VKSRNTWEAAIIGCGPAAYATAISLADCNFPVAILGRSKSTFPYVGETLEPSIVPWLRQLGVWNRFLADEHLPSRATISVWGEEERPHEYNPGFNPYSIGWHVDRQRFDAMLAAAAAARGVTTLLDMRLLTCSRSATGNWQLEALHRGERFCLRSRFLIDATGRSSWLARRLGAQRLYFDRLIGVVGDFDLAETEPSALVLEATESGWWYSVALRNNRLVAVFMTDPILRPRSAAGLSAFWDNELARTSLTRRRICRSRQRRRFYIATADSYVMNRVAGENWLAVGDAAMAWDPLASQGIKNALRSGVLAAQSIDRARAGQTIAFASYEATVALNFRYFQQGHAYYYSQVRRWPDSVFWRTRRSRSTLRRNNEWCLL
jgi:2-polyprenyl-6-methoxyphenol hydroxylase-like FAD-dependent oxidoreductase